MILVVGKWVVVLGDMLEFGEVFVCLYVGFCDVIMNGYLDEVYLIGGEMGVLKDVFLKVGYLVG